MIPASAATQKMRRAATCRSYSGNLARSLAQIEGDRAPRARCLPSPSASVPLSGTGAKLIASTSAATSTIDRMPPRLSTGSVVSLTWLGTSRIASTSGDRRERQRDQEHRAPGVVLEQRARRAAGPSAEIAPPMPDHSAIDLRARRARPQRGDQRERRRVGHAGRQPAEDARADQHLALEAVAARIDAGIASSVPSTSISLRPYRSPSAPRYSTDAARPSE